MVERPERGLTFHFVAAGAGGVDVPQGLHEGRVHLDAAVGDGQVLRDERSDPISIG